MHERLDVALPELVDGRYAHILTYPTSSPEEAKSRVAELAGIRVSALRFTGTSMIGGVPILGKGCVGIVTEGYQDGRIVALKIRRLDADRPSMGREARLLRLANSVNVGPRLIAATKNFLVMELFKGAPLFRWADNLSPSRSAVKGLLLGVLESCFRLDAIGLDHGELSHAPKNVLVNRYDTACIVDFESASTARRVANVTSLLQYFLFGNISKILHSSRIFPERRVILKALAEYKQAGTIDSFQHILQALDLA